MPIAKPASGPPQLDCKLTKKARVSKSWQKYASTGPCMISEEKQMVRRNYQLVNIWTLSEHNQLGGIQRIIFKLLNFF